MRLKLLCGSVFVLFMTVAAVRSSAQARYAATESHSQLSVGGGFSTYNSDWDNRYEEGYTAWADYHPLLFHGPVLHDFSLEGEFRGLTFFQPTGQYPGDKNVHSTVPTYYTAGGGLIWEPGRFTFHRITPYVKTLWSWGSLSWYAPGSTYSSDTRTATQLGGGVDYHISHRITARVDYEYQFWPKLFGPNATTPHGFTFGALYNFNFGRHRDYFAPEPVPAPAPVPPPPPPAPAPAPQNQ